MPWPGVGAGAGAGLGAGASGRRRSKGVTMTNRIYEMMSKLSHPIVNKGISISSKGSYEPSSMQQQDLDVIHQTEKNLIFSARKRFCRPFSRDPKSHLLSHRHHTATSCDPPHHFGKTRKLVETQKVLQKDFFRRCRGIRKVRFNCFPPESRAAPNHHAS